MIETILNNYTSISIIGMSKNAGKTTVLNHILSLIQKPVGVTSVGLDGEELDTITQLPKPNITVYNGMVIATAKDCLKKSTAHLELLKETTFHTPLGPIIIGKVVKEGTILLAGPSTNKGLQMIKEELVHYGAETILIDGALFRKSIAAYNVSDTVILATGASYSKNMNTVIHDTKELVNWFSLKEYDGVYKDSFVKSDTSMIVKQNECIAVDDEYTIHQVDTVLSNLSTDLSVWYLNGALTNRIIDYFIQHKDTLNTLELVIRDVSCILTDYDSMRKLDYLPVTVSLLHKTPLSLVTLNPVAPGLYEFDKDEFYHKLNQEINLPVINVLEKRSDINE